MSLTDISITPDFDAFIRTLLYKEPPKRVFHSELFLDGPVKYAIMDRFHLSPQESPDNPLFDVKLDTMLYRFLGYDMVRVHLPESEFPMNIQGATKADGASHEKRERENSIDENAPIRSWQDFESYPWPRISALDTRPLEWAEKNLPEGMKAYELSDQFFECSTWLMGFQGMFTSMYDNVELLDAVLQKVGETYLDYTRLLCDFDCVGVICGTDDMGFKTDTMVSPEWLKNNILTWHQKGAAIAHDKGKRYFLHSCGQVDALMEDLITKVKIDAKHSFEDEVYPVTDFYRKYGKRIGVIGGVDMNFLATAQPDEVRKRVRETLEICHPQGGYALGSGNSIAYYIPLDNYLAMLEEGRKFAPD
ncbi:hypothetical protein JW926_13000 [Candidatus Sumerlaeota bacterium]|nr:hypothetical protein [Candidatus Sumerlaeota bacterium]